MATETSQLRYFCSASYYLTTCLRDGNWNFAVKVLENVSIGFNHLPERWQLKQYTEVGIHWLWWWFNHLPERWQLKPKMFSWINSLIPFNHLPERWQLKLDCIRTTGSRNNKFNHLPEMPTWISVISCCCKATHLKQLSYRHKPKL